MSWFRVNGGRLEYRGRITRASFTKWTATKEGAAAVARVASGIRFSVLGRSRSARRRMWLALEAASRVESLAAAIGVEATRYMQVMASLSYADALPRAHIELHRLVLVPRAMIAGRALTGLFERLAQAPALAEIDEAVHIFLFNQLVIEMDAAIHEASSEVFRQPDVGLDEEIAERGVARAADLVELSAQRFTIGRVECHSAHHGKALHH